SYSSYFFTPKSKTSGNLIIATCFNQFSFYGFTPTIDIEPFKKALITLNKKPSQLKTTMTLYGRGDRT
ncbi:MAG: hypothetical protein UC379_00005, partial [Acutalibacteraceae bacterium]|nr:hypothetical protein [Acutalibacteraceae bacterium]